MDVAGTAVGIASLGIQVCQGLLLYYDDWKAYDFDISSTYSAITDLSKTLTLLTTTLQQEFDDERVGRVRTCVEDCEDALLELEKRRYSLHKYGQPEGLRQKMRAGLQRTWYPFRKETLEALKISVQNIQDRLKLALQVLQLDFGIESQRLVHRLLSQTATQSASIAHTVAQNQRIMDTQRLDEFRKIVAWLAPPDPGTNHATARQRHESQTGDWLLNSNEYQSWKTGSVSHMWMFGKAGSGKTILCSTAIEDIRNTCGQDSDISYAFFYFSFSDDHKQSDGDLLLSLVAQLGWRDSGLCILRQAFGDPRRGVPRSDELEEILLASIRSCGMVYLFMDAIDECPDDQDARQNVLERIEKLTQGASNLKVFATSRELPAIRDFLKGIGCEPLRIATSAVDVDILTYVANQLLSDRSFSRFSPTSITTIKTTIANRSDGMFRWAYCQLQALKKLKSTAPKYVKRTLDALPATLDETYTRVLLDIEDMYSEHALTLLRWLAYARSPPTLGELVEAAIIHPADDSSIDVENRGGLEDTLNILSELITVDGSQVAEMESESYPMIKSPIFSDLTTAHVQTEVAPWNPNLTSNTRLRLAHFSVKEYLESKRILTSDARHFSLDSATGHKHLAQSCLTYLGYYSASNKKTLTTSDLSEFPLLRYAAQSWPYHSRLQHHDSVGRETSFLQTEQARNDWLLIHKPDKSWLSPFEEAESSADSGCALYYASLLGLPAVVSTLLDSGANSNVCGGRFGNPLSAASSRGHQAVVHLLLNNHALVNAQGGHLGNALQAASSAGCAELVRLLLGKGACVNAQGGHFGNALQVASFRGFPEIVQLLLEKGAAVNIQSGHFNTAIRAAALGGHIKVIQLLLENGANIRPSSTEYGSALEAASFGGREEIVRLLLKGGADPNARGGMFDNCLFAALGRGHSRVAHLLLEVGADVNAAGRRYGSALQAASFGGCIEMVQLLLNRGASVNAYGGQHGYALQAASCRGFINVVQLLLDEGAEVNAEDGDCRSALQAASSCGHHDVVLTLLDRGADVNACGNYGSALYLASQGGHKKIAGLLLDRGAQVNGTSGYHNTALQAALSGGHADVACLLRASGASETTKNVADTKARNGVKYIAEP